MWRNQSTEVLLPGTNCAINEGSVFLTTLFVGSAELFLQSCLSTSQQFLNNIFPSSLCYLEAIEYAPEIFLCACLGFPVNDANTMSLLSVSQQSIEIPSQTYVIPE